ncbi:MAG: hypothetical protein Q7J10_04775 [Methanosarcinaceae archaeon]|nr:hypothetical protein [Methanosarcinaceae archaeon]
MNKNKSMLAGIFIGTLMVIMGTFSNYTDETTLSLSAIVVGMVVGFSIESKQLKFIALAVIIQQIIGIGITLFNDPDLDVVLSYGAITGLVAVVLLLEILFNVILGSFIGSIARKYRK